MLGGQELNAPYAHSAFFNITDQSRSSSATSTPILGSTATSTSVPALSTVQTATSNGLSRETLGIALGIGIPGLMVILATLFVLLKLLKQGTLPDKNPPQSTSRRVRPDQQIFEANGDFIYRAELSGDRIPPHFAELPA